MRQTIVFNNTRQPVKEHEINKRDYSNDPLGFKVYDGTLQFCFTYSKYQYTETIPYPPILYYSFNKRNWTLWSDIYTPIEVQSGETLYLYGSENNCFSNLDNIATYRYGQQIKLKVIGNGKFDATGNFLSIMNPDINTPVDLTLTSQQCTYDGSHKGFARFKSFFSNITQLYNAKDLHIKCYKMSDNNYSIDFGYFFEGCTNLQTGCVFDNTVYVPLTYSSQAFAIAMYWGCTNLRESTIPPVGTTGNRMLESLFQNCTNLHKITHNNSLPSLNYTGFSSGVGNTGDFYNLGGATYTTGITGIPSGWTIHTSL